MYFKTRRAFCLCVLSAFLLSGVAFAETGATGAKAANKKPVNNATDLKTGKGTSPAVSSGKITAKMPPDPLETQKAAPVEKPKATSSRDKVSSAGYNSNDDGTIEPIQERPNPLDSKLTPRANTAPVR